MSEVTYGPLRRNLGREIYMREHPCTHGYTEECKQWAENYTPPATSPCAVDITDRTNPQMHQFPYVPYPTLPGWGKSKSPEVADALFNDCRELQFYKAHRAVKHLDPSNQKSRWNTWAGIYMPIEMMRASGSNYSAPKLFSETAFSSHEFDGMGFTPPYADPNASTRIDQNTGLGQGHY